MNKIFKKFTFNGKFILIFSFLWALLVAVVVQLIILPTFSEIHGGHGLIKGGDWVDFHEQATQMATAISHHGWEVWEIQPSGNFPIGYAASIYYLTGIKEPFILLPFNALIFSICAYLLQKTLSLIASDFDATVATMPFVLAPTGIMIYAQLHKDLFSIFGEFAFIFTWAEVIKNKRYFFDRNSLKYYIIYLIGIFCIWIDRAYLLQIFILFIIISSAILFLDISKLSLREKKVPLLIVSLIITPVSFYFVKPVSYSVSPFETAVNGVASQPLHRDLDKQNTYTVTETMSPRALQGIVDSIELMRAGFGRTLNNGSIIDSDVHFDNIVDVIKYIPRALEIGLFEPLPTFWATKGPHPTSRVMRLVAAIEMPLSYLLIFCAMFYTIRYRYNLVLLYIILFVLLRIGILVMVVCNLGAIYRMRYGCWQILNGIGILGCLLIKDKIIESKSKS